MTVPCADTTNAVVSDEEEDVERVPLVVTVKTSGMFAVEDLETFPLAETFTTVDTEAVADVTL